MAITFNTNDPIKRATLAAANTWVEVNIPGSARTFTINNESAADAVYFAWLTVNGDAGGVSPLDNYVTIPAGDGRQVQLGQGERSRAGVPTSVFVGRGAGASTDVALEAE